MHSTFPLEVHCSCIVCIVRTRDILQLCRITILQYN